MRLLNMAPIPNSADILQAVIEATPDAIFVKDLDGRYVIVNQAAARFAGRRVDEMVGKNDLELYPEETARRFMADDQAVLAGRGSAMAFEGVATSGSGTQAYLVTKGVYRDANGAVLGLYGISHDITELRKAQDSLEETRAALFRSQKMEAVGQLTGGISHDFNNILMVILGNLELLKLRLPEGDHQAIELIDETLRATHHGQDLTGDLLAFSRRRQLNPQPVGINALVEHLVRLLSRALGATIQITTTTSRDAGVALVDPAALEAAILNIALNGRDAMPDGGTLTIRTSSADITEEPRTDDDLAIGQYAVIAIQDTGTGMTPEIVAKVFEPFFTTKLGGGSGLGLSMVYGFAKQSGGTVTITSEAGHGTTVILYLPLTRSEPATTAAPALPLMPPVLSRTILLVEDEVAVRATVRRQLETLGHKVVMAATAAVAWDLLRGAEPPPDVLVTDVVLGAGMNGIDLADAARRAIPGLPVVFMSGFTAVPEAQARIRALGAPLLSKPSTLSQLERALHAVCPDTSTS